MSYREELEEAAERTLRFGLEKPTLVKSHARYLTDDALTRIGTSISEACGTFRQSEIVAQCLALHLRLRPIIEEVTKAPAYFTLGHVFAPPNYMYKQTEESLKSMIKNGVQNREVQLHAWLTLPSDEIIDLTIATSMAVINNWKTGHGAIIATHAEELKNGVRYHPMIIGEEFLFRTGAMRFVPH